MAFTSSTSQTTYRWTTTGLGLTVLPDGIANTNTVFANGAITMILTAHANHTFGTGYGTVTAGDLVTVNAKALSYDASQDVTVTNATTDTVNGITLSATANQNVAKFTINVAMEPGDVLLQKASQFKGIEMVDNDTADIYFEPHSNDGLGNGVDKVRLSYKAGNFKLLCDSINAIITDERDKAGLIVVADTYRNVFLNNNITGVTAIDALTLDS
jgi:hypothetical protein